MRLLVLVRDVVERVGAGRKGAVGSAEVGRWHDGRGVDPLFFVVVELVYYGRFFPGRLVVGEWLARRGLLWRRVLPRLSDRQVEGGLRRGLDRRFGATRQLPL